MNRRAILGLFGVAAASLHSGSVRADGVRRNVAVASPAGWDAAAKPRQTNAFPDLKRLGPAREVRSVEHSPGAYRLAMADGASAVFLEAGLGFKIDSSDIGPREGTPVLLPAGRAGDRALVFFASPVDMLRFIKTTAA